MLLLNSAVINYSKALQYPKGLYDSPKNHINHDRVGCVVRMLLRPLNTFLKLSGSFGAY